MMNYCVEFAVVVLAFSLIVSAENGQPEPGEDLRKEGSPIYIYMDRLRKVTRTSQSIDSTGEDSQTPGTLLATSFKNTCKWHDKLTFYSCSQLLLAKCSATSYNGYRYFLQTLTVVRLAEEA